MTQRPLIAPLPIIELGPNYSIVLEAIDPTTGATVAGVTISDATIYAVTDPDSLPPDTSTLTTWLNPTAD